RSGDRTVIITGGRDQVAVGPDGGVFNGTNGAMAGWEPDGTLRWSYTEWPLNTGSAPDVSPDGRLYYVRNLAYLTVLDTKTGALLRTYQDGSILDRPIVSPDNSVIALIGAPNYGVPGFFKGVSPAGELLWQVDLGQENGGNVISFTGARFTSGAETAYFA